MKYLVFVLALCGFSNAFANNKCARYEGQARYMKAIEIVAKAHDLTLEELCTLPRIWDVEAQPSRIIIRDGTVIPHVRVQLHMETSSCLFMVNDLTGVITQQNCYSGTLRFDSILSFGFNSTDQPKGMDDEDVLSDTADCGTFDLLRT